MVTKRKAPACAGAFLLVDLMGFEPTTSRMRTERARKVVSFLPTDCGVWFGKELTILTDSLFQYLSKFTFSLCCVC